MTTSFIEHSSPLGTLLLAATDQGLCGLYFEQHQYFDGPQDWRRDPAHPQLWRAAQQLDEYFAGRRTAFDVPLDLSGTPISAGGMGRIAGLPFGATDLSADRTPRREAMQYARLVRR